jgi:hypothetical protein
MLRLASARVGASPLVIHEPSLPTDHSLAQDDITGVARDVEDLERPIA